MSCIPSIRLAQSLFCGLLMLFTGLCLRTVSAAGVGDYSIRTWQTEDGLPQNSVHCIAQTPDGFLWLGTSDGLVRFDGLRFTTFANANAPGLPTQKVFALAVGKDGSLWLGTDNR